MTKKEIGKTVKSAFKAKKWTIYRLWKASDVKANVIISILDANSSYTIDSLLKVCDALEIELVGNVKEPA